jgi:Domain of unknown function (DUF4260)
MRPSFPKILLHLEGLAVLVACVAAYAELGDSWVKFGALFFAPDLAMFGYLVSPEFGSKSYNLFHTYLGPFLLWLFVYFFHYPSFAPICLIWIAHIGFDRMLGYGLKYPTRFKDTHLNRI